MYAGGCASGRTRGGEGRAGGGGGCALDAARVHGATAWEVAWHLRLLLLTLPALVLLLALEAALRRRTPLAG